MLRRLFPALATLCVLSCTSLLAAQAVAPQPQDQAKAAPPPAKNDYSKEESWLCRPGRQDACVVDLNTTIVAADGKLKHESWKADAHAPVDCFYVYPTVSNDPTPNSDMVPGPEERNVVRLQLARFASRCRLYAPLYRQVTLAALRAMFTGNAMAPPDRALAYHDVQDAWHYYLQHDNNGRGIVLIGHSQGSGVLTQLIRDEIDGKAVQAHIVSALLLGTTLPVPKGKDVGGAFQHLPLCHEANQTGCVITYASFRANALPPANSLFGKVQNENMIAACTNPAALAGGSGELHAYLSSRGNSIATNVEAEPAPWTTPPQPIDTPFVSVPGMLTAECVNNASGSYLAVTVHSDPAGPRTKDIVGDVVVNKQVRPEWGLHLIDVGLAMGNLVDIVGQQSKAYLAATGKK